MCPPEDPDTLGGLPVLLAKAAVDVGIGAAAVLVNLFIVCAVLSGRALHRRSRASTIIVLNLAVSDMLGGVMQVRIRVSSHSVIAFSFTPNLCRKLMTFLCAFVLLLRTCPYLEEPTRKQTENRWVLH